AARLRELLLAVPGRPVDPATAFATFLATARLKAQSDRSAFARAMDAGRAFTRRLLVAGAPTDTIVERPRRVVAPYVVLASLAIAMGVAWWGHARHRATVPPLTTTPSPPAPAATPPPAVPALEAPAVTPVEPAPPSTTEPT